MKLKNVLITVNDMERAISFYKNMFGLDVIQNSDGNVVMTEGLALQDAGIWKDFLGRDIIPRSNASELYFEERDLEGFVERLERYGQEHGFEIHYVNRLLVHSWGQTVVRFYDPDGNLIEVGTPVGD